MVPANAFYFSNLFFSNVFGVEVDTNLAGELVGCFIEGNQFGGDYIRFFSSEVQTASDENDCVGGKLFCELVQCVWEQDYLDLALKVEECKDGHFGAGVSAGFGEVVADFGNKAANSNKNLKVDNFIRFIQLNTFIGILSGV